MTNEPDEAALGKAYQRFINTTNSELQQNWSDDFDPEKITKRDLKSAIQVYLDETKLQDKLKAAEEALETISEVKYAGWDSPEAETALQALKQIRG